MGSPAEQEAGNHHRWVLLGLTSVGAFMTPLDGSIVAVALPKMGPLLNLSFAASLWVQAAYLLSLAVLLIPVGRLADQHGRMRFYLAGTAIFTVASLAAALSWNGPSLILSRILQGIGGALLHATSAAIVASVFPAQERGRALGINVMAVYLGLSVGPPLGGFLVDRFGWPWIFLVNLPIGLGVFLWGWRLLPRRGTEHQDAAEARKAGRLDLPGAALLATLLVALLVPLTFAPNGAGLPPASGRCWAFRPWPSEPSRLGRPGRPSPWWTWTCCAGTSSSRQRTLRPCSTTWRFTPSPSSPPSTSSSCRDGPRKSPAGSCSGSRSCRPA